MKMKWRLKGGHKQETNSTMPSTDYSSEIETVGSNVNLFDKDNPDMFLKGLVPNNDGEIQVGNTNTSDSNYQVTIIVPCLPNSTYIISRYVEGKTFFVYESSKGDLKVGDNVTFLKRNNNTGIINEKITTGANAKYLLVKIYNTYATEPNTYNDLISSVKLEKGIVATPWSAYATGCTEIKVQNRNFLYYTAQNQTINGVEFLINKDKSIKVKGTATAVTDFYLIGNANTYEDIRLTGNFKISGCKSNSWSTYMLYVVQKDINNKLSYYQNIQESVNITIKKGDTFRVFIRVLSQITVNDTIFPTLQSLDDNNSICVESKKQTIVMPVQQEMLQGDYIEDVEHHEWGKYIFTGKETIENIGKSGDITFFKTSLSNLSDFNYIDDNTVNYMCTHFKAIKVADRFQNNTFFINIEKKVSLCSQEITTIDALKAYLKARYDANDPVVIYYKLTNAIDLELTEAQKAVREQKLHTYKNVTNINLSDELASIDVTYKKDLDTILNNLQAQIITNASEEV